MKSIIGSTSCNLWHLQLNMLAEGLINHPAVGFGESGRKASDLRTLLTKIEESEVCFISG